MTRKKQIIRTVIIALVTILIIDIGFKLALVIYIKDLEKNIAIKSNTEFVYEAKKPENPIDDEDVVFDQRYNLSRKQTGVNGDFVTYESDDKSIQFSTEHIEKAVSLNVISEEIRDYHFLTNFLLTNRSIHKYFSKKNVSSAGELIFLTYKDEKPINTLSVFYPLPLFRQEATRAFLRAILIPYTAEGVYCSQNEDFYIRMLELQMESGRYYQLSLYAKDDSKTYFYALRDKNSKITPEEAIDFFETVSVKQ